MGLHSPPQGIQVRSGTATLCRRIPLQDLGAFPLWKEEGRSPWPEPGALQRFYGSTDLPVVPSVPAKARTESSFDTLKSKQGLNSGIKAVGRTL